MTLELPDDLKAEITATTAKEFPVSGKRGELKELALVAEKAIKFYQEHWANVFNEENRHLPFGAANRKRLEHPEIGCGMAFRLKVIEMQTAPGNATNKNWLLHVLKRALEGKLLSQNS